MDLNKKIHFCIFFFSSTLTQYYFLKVLDKCNVTFVYVFLLFILHTVLSQFQIMFTVTFFLYFLFKHSYHAVLHPGNIEAICQKLIDNFFKQSPAMQESVAMRLQALKVALYSTNFSSREKASDCHTRLVLQAINALFRCLLRPKNITSQDKVGQAQQSKYDRENAV